jgi:hypothetical protein
MRPGHGRMGCAPSRAGWRPSSVVATRPGRNLGLGRASGPRARQRPAHPVLRSEPSILIRRPGSGVQYRMPINSVDLGRFRRSVETLNHSTLFPSHHTHPAAREHCLQIAPCSFLCADRLACYTVTRLPETAAVGLWLTKAQSRMAAHALSVFPFFFILASGHWFSGVHAAHLSHGLSCFFYDLRMFAMLCALDQIGG